MITDMDAPSLVLDGSPAIDPEAIEQLRFLEDEDQPNVVAGLVALFLEHTPTRVASIREALRAEDPVALRSAAHSLKGSAANVGARGMQRLCEQLEHSPAALADGQPLLALLEAEFAVVAKALATIC